MFRSREIVAAAAMVVSSLGWVGVAQGQESLGRVEVTGSRIRSPNAESAAPVQVITAAEIEASGSTNVQDLLLRNPGTAVPSFSRTNSNFQSSSFGVATIGLRNLGTGRTLVLINGRRVVAGIPGESAVDLNTIPTQFVERIELLTGGASAAYGSDAIAGVINIILKKDITGVQFDLRTGQSGHGDDKRTELGLTLGRSLAEGRGNLSAHLGYSRQGIVRSADRDLSAVDQASTGAAVTGNPADFFRITRPFYSSVAPQGRFFVGNGSGSQSRTYDRNGSIIGWSANGSATLPASGFDRSPYRTIALPTDRFLFSSNGHLEVAAGHRIFLEATYASTRATSELEPLPLDSDKVFPATQGRFAAESRVAGALVRNPNVPAAMLALMQDTDGDGLRDYRFTRRLSEIGSRRNTADRDMLRVVTGVEGELNRGWDYRSYVANGLSRESQAGTGLVSLAHVRNALDAVPEPGNPAGVCRDATARAQGCVPLDVFGRNSITPAAAAYIGAPSTFSSQVRQTLVGGSISGSPFQLTQAGPVDVAVGVEYRREASSSESDILTQTGQNAGNAVPNTRGGFHVREVYGEMKVPVLRNLRFARSLGLSAAVRVADYSTVGDTLSYNTGLEWAANEVVKVRGSYALSTRAPDARELFAPPSQTYPAGLSDPCEGVTATSTQAAAAACRAHAGVAANIAANGAFTLNQQDFQGVSGFDRGNPRLSEEKGRSRTLGLVVTPRGRGILSNVVLTADYFDITVDDAVILMPRQFALNQCYAGNGGLCRFITRRTTGIGANSAGSLAFVDSETVNGAELSTRGVDLTAATSHRIARGVFSGSISWTHVLDGYVIPVAGLQKDHFVGEVGSAKDKLALRLGYEIGAFSVATQIAHVGKSSLDDQYLLEYGLDRDSVRVPSRTYVDLSVRYRLTRSTEVYGGIDNAFDTRPVVLPTGLPGNDAGTETNAGTYDAIGRRYHVGLRMRF